jgi:predicted nucleotidyltransferase
MTSTSRLGRQIQETVSALDEIGVPFALIGGLALAPHNVIRATQDVDLLVDGNNTEAIHAKLTNLGYECLHRSLDAGNYLRNDERLDLLYATRPIARRVLAGAKEFATSFGKIRVISAEGLIGFKLQAVVNNPRRARDLEDIRALLRANRATLNREEVRDYFRLFDREAQLDELLNEAE